MNSATSTIPLHRKLPLVTVITCALVVGLASLAYLVRDIVSYRGQLQQGLSTLAQVIGKNSTAALTFQDREVATRLLSALAGKPDVLYAGTYDRESCLFAVYQAPSLRAAPLPPLGTPGPSHRPDGTMCVTEPVVLDGTLLGSVHICASNGALRTRTFGCLQFVALVITILMVLALLLSRWMLARIMQPLKSLAAAARRISRDQDYSVRVHGEGVHEVSELVTAFNMMLEQVESTSATLKDSAQHLRTHRERLRSLSQALQTAEERERHELAVAVHDSVCQTLCALQMELAMLAARQDISAAATDQLGYLKDLVATAIREARSLTTRLFPRGLLELGLCSALSGLAAEILAKHGLRIDVDARDPAELNFEKRILAFRCVQELLRNIVKHARAGTARVSCAADADTLHIQVSDDGVGFDLEQVMGAPRLDGGFGLFSVIERIEAADGKVHIDSGTGKGTRITLELPLGATRKSAKESVRGTRGEEVHDEP